MIFLRLRVNYYIGKEVEKISFSIVLNIVGYAIYLLILTGSVYYMYHLLTTKEERRFYRMKLEKEVVERSDKVKKKELESKLQQKMDFANINFFNAFHFQLIRIFILLYIIFYYVIGKYLEGDSILLTVIFLIAFLVLTEPRFKYSLVNVILNSIIKRKQKFRIVELFTLFDILKAELNTLKVEQEVNVYNTIKNVLPMFKHINGTLSKFLSMWKKSPKQAKEIFHDEIGGDNAKALADILYKLDNVSKKEALEVIDSESSVFSNSYYQKALQQSGKATTVYHGVFLTVNILVVLWLIVFVSVMVSEGMNNSF